MDLKYMHNVLKANDTIFKRFTSIMYGSRIKTIYKFVSDIPYLGDRSVISYIGESSVVYDYSSLLNASDEIDTKNFKVETFSLSNINLTKYEEIIHKNIVVANRMRSIRDQADILAELANL